MGRLLAPGQKLVEEQLSDGRRVYRSSIPLPDNLPDILERLARWAEAQPDTPLLSEPRDGARRSISYGEALARARAVRQMLSGRYGLRKVYKREFDRDPERYVLRIDYPDFPECPFGESFSMLGFDTAEQTYVWLVTSILRDSRLNRIPYQSLDVPDNE